MLSEHIRTTLTDTTASDTNQNTGMDTQADLPTLLGPTLLQKAPLPTGVSPQVPPEQTYRWPSISCSRCCQKIIGPRFSCQEDKIDLCVACIEYAVEVHPEHILESMPIPDHIHRSPAVQVATTDVLTDKYVLLYFCYDDHNTCEFITDMFLPYYEKMQKKGANFEIVLISSDEDEDWFNEHYATLPWLALPYAERDTFQSLVERFQVNDMPTAILLDPQGQIVLEQAALHIRADPEGLFCPYHKRSLCEILGNEFIYRDGKTVDGSVFRGKYLGLFFGASWYGTNGRLDARPVIDNAVETARVQGHEIEILFCSEEFDHDELMPYFQTMPWLMHPADIALYCSLELEDFFCPDKPFTSQFDLKKFVLLDRDLQVVNRNAYASIVANVEAFPWRPVPVADISDGIDANGNSLHLAPSLIVYCHTMESQDDVATVESTLTMLAGEFSDLAFFTSKYVGQKDYTDLPHDFLGRVWKKTKHVRQKEDGPPFALLLDIPKGKCYVHQDNMSEEALRDVVLQFKANALSMIPFNNDHLDK
ncbi:hypothetical protein LEN26_020711 [Aphanomyces euteiches]|nr:hypothetical protein LEN26_020711 [Aphanomyces euteiches]KAH9101894.1 hypothetical protein AeMF1_021423 [Aphanomyces euteiches]KAH9186641.1 hypothetical protein AeNC1_011381 [Aphanomyces euteiches]